MKQVDLIISADWHIREKPPVAWVGKYLKEQRKALEAISKLQQEHNYCPVAVAGDVFDRHDPAPFLIAWAIKNFPNEVIAVPGQHDLPNHNISRYKRCGLNVLDKAGKANVLIKEEGYVHFKPAHFGIKGFGWGSYLDSGKLITTGKNVALCHVMTYKNKLPYPGCSADNATKLMKKMKNFDLIITGDNHQPFTVKKDNQLLVNPGSLMRINAGQIDHKPRVYLWNAEDNEVEAVYLPQNEGDVSRDHIDIKNEHDERLEAFVSRLEDDVDIGLSFEKNLKEFMDVNKTSKATKEKVWEMIGQEI